jgi:hypothetical protein
LNYVLFDALFFEFFCRTTNFWFLALIFLRKDPSTLNLPLLILKPPRLVIIRMGMKPKVLWREVPPLSPPPAKSETQGAKKKRKCTEDLTSSGTSNLKDVQPEQTTSKGSGLDIFELLDL